MGASQAAMPNLLACTSAGCTQGAPDDQQVCFLQDGLLHAGIQPDEHIRYRAAVAHGDAQLIQDAPYTPLLEFAAMQDGLLRASIQPDGRAHPLQLGRHCGRGDTAARAQPLVHYVRGALTEVHIFFITLV